MKEYIETIESILEIPLEAKAIQSFDFKDGILEKLVDFVENYSGIADDTDRPNPLICFLSLPDIISNNFSTYTADGDLGTHWPDNLQLLNSLLFNDQVLIHDHLKHYASSPLSGYVIGHRYDGIKNWLTALARWREMIMRGVIRIVPQDLSYSPSIRKIWDDELFIVSKDLLSSYDEYIKDLIEQGYEEDCVMEIHEVAFLLAAMSIPGKELKPLIPFISKEETFNLYEGILYSFCDKSFTQHQAGKIPEINQIFSAKMRLESNLFAAENDEVDLSFVLESREQFADIRTEINSITELLAAPDVFNETTQLQINDLIRSKEKEWNLRLGKMGNTDASDKRDIILGFYAGHLPGISSEKPDRMHSAYQAILETYNNTSQKLASKEQLLHYYFSVL